MTEYNRDGTSHRQPTLARRIWCILTNGHEPKFGANPRGSCIRCGYWSATRVVRRSIAGRLWVAVLKMGPYALLGIVVGRVAQGGDVTSVVLMVAAFVLMVFGSLLRD